MLHLSAAKNFRATASPALTTEETLQTPGSHFSRTYKEFCLTS